MPRESPIIDPRRDADRVVASSRGCIEMIAGRLSGVDLNARWLWTGWETSIGLGDWRHRRRPGDRCWLYYFQPRRQPRYLAVKYVFSTGQASLKTFRGALVVLDEIARLKHSDAIVADVVNWRISSRLLERWGWEPLRIGRWHRRYVKRFYGCYPDPDAYFGFVNATAATFVHALPLSGELALLARAAPVTLSDSAGGANPTFDAIAHGSS